MLTIPSVLVTFCALLLSPDATATGVASPVNSTGQPARALRAATELLNADRSFGSASAGVPLAAGMRAMFADSAFFPMPNGQFAHTSAAFLRALDAVPESQGASATWSPIRAGVSADGRDGFTIGHMTVTTANGARIPYRYIAYWRRDSNDWRVVAYRRRRAEAAGTATAMQPSLPSAEFMSREGNARPGVFRYPLEHYRSLVAAEKMFSDSAQVIGLGVAFQRFGREDAVNMGPPNVANFIVGAEAIGRSVVGPEPLAAPSPVSWGADTALVAASGDLGITFGVIRQNSASGNASSAPGASFFTIWRRESMSGPWRYIAE